MQRILPAKPIRGFQFPQLLLYALIDSGFIVITKNGYTVINDDLFYLDNEELEEVLQTYLAKRDA